MMSGDNLTTSLAEVDPVIYSLCQEEKERQISCLELIASENFASKAVLETLSSCFHNKYSEGVIHHRYYGGNEIVDRMETLCHERALAAFHLSPKEWGVNVQPYSGSPANFQVYTGLLSPGARIMGLDLPDGGHLTHGFQTATKKISASSLYFESMPYKVNPDTGLIDYDGLAKSARLFRPKLIVAGISCYSQNLDYKRFREICDETGAILMADMAHISGLVATGVMPGPFEYADVVTTTTHKTLRGPRSGMIFFRRGVKKIDKNGKPVHYDYEKRIQDAVFPGLQGGPHNNNITALCVALKMAQEPDFVEYQRQVVANCQFVCKEFIKLGYKIVTGGSVNHMCLVDFRPIGTEGAKVEKIFDMAKITINMNTCPGDKNALRPSGVRIGTAALTSRNFKEKDFKVVVDFLHEGIQLTLEAQKRFTGKTIAEFKTFVENDAEILKKVEDMKSRVEKFARQYPIPGYAHF